MSRLDTQVFASNSFIIGIADLRGDGRPDYAYHAHVLYADSIVQPRLPVSGGAITLQGIGFTPGLNVAVGSISVPTLVTSAGQMTVVARAQSDGTQNVTVTDLASGAFSIMTGVLTFGAAATDKIVLLQGANPPTPVGTQATNPMIVKVVSSDGITPVGGATVGWASTGGVGLSICGGSSTCSTFTDESGIASTWLTPGATGVASIVATVAPGVYSPPQSVSGTLFALSSSLDLGITPPLLWVAQGANVSVPITARVLDTGVPLSGVTMTFVVAVGTGSLSASSAVTNSSGYASVTLTLTNFTSNMQVTACVTGGSPCQAVKANPVAPALVNLQAVAGAGQVIAGQVFQPLTVRVTDSSMPPNAVLGASVLFQSSVLRPAGNPPGTGTGMPVLLGASQSSVVSDANGLASLVPSVGSFTGTLEVEIEASTGVAAALEDVMESYPLNSGESSAVVSGDPWRGAFGPPIIGWDRDWKRVSDLAALRPDDR